MLRGVVWGTITSYVYDNGTSKFPTHIYGKTSLGSGGMDVVLKGNETINKNIKGIEVTVTISGLFEDQAEFSRNGVGEEGYLAGRLEV